MVYDDVNNECPSFSGLLKAENLQRTSGDFSYPYGWGVKNIDIFPDIFVLFLYLCGINFSICKQQTGKQNVIFKLAKAKS
jgi:hypothetical protein